MVSTPSRTVTSRNRPPTRCAARTASGSLANRSRSGWSRCASCASAGSGGPLASDDPRVVWTVFVISRYPLSCHIDCATFADERKGPKTRRRLRIPRCRCVQSYAHCDDEGARAAQRRQRCPTGGVRTADEHPDPHFGDPADHHQLRSGRRSVLRCGDGDHVGRVHRRLPRARAAASWVRPQRTWDVRPRRRGPDRTVVPDTRPRRVAVRGAGPSRSPCSNRQGQRRWCAPTDPTAGPGGSVHGAARCGLLVRCVRGRETGQRRNSPTTAIRCSGPS